MPLSILSLNLWHDLGPWDARAKRILEWIDRLDPDLIGFQEALRSESQDQVAELLTGRGYHLDYSRAQPFWRDTRIDFGNAVATRWPIHDREEIQLPDGDDGETRSALSVTLESPHGPLSFTCTHLNWKYQHGAIRERQVVAVCDFVLRRRLRDGFPSILVGDFNAEPDSAEIRYVTGRQSLHGRSVYFHDAWRVAGQGGTGDTWCNRNPYARINLEPERRIDYIFTGLPLRNGLGLIESCRVVCDDERDGVWPSDHFGLFATLRTDPIPGLG